MMRNTIARGGKKGGGRERLERARHADLVTVCS